MTTPIIQIKELYKSYPSFEGPVYVLKNINLEIEEGDFVAIVGQSGSGKSTLMNILGGLDKPTKGTYEIYGTEISQLSPDELAELRCNHFGFIFQRYQLISGLTALENVEMPAIYSGLSMKERQEKATEILSKLGLKERLDHTPGQLSGGQQQRVSISRALINGGEVIFADEPTGALDSKSGEDVMGILQDLNRNGHTIIMVTHDPLLAKQAKRIIEIKDGEVINDTRLDTNIIKPSEELNKNKNKQFNFSSFFANLRENYKMALRSIINNKLRSFLTMLGIIFGIASVISMVAIGNGTVSNLLSQLGEETARSMFIFKGREFKATNLTTPSKSFHDDDFTYLRSLPYLKNVIPSISATVIMQYGDTSVNARVEACDYDCIKSKDLVLQQGHGFTKENIQNLSLVAIVDEDSAKEMFVNSDPIDKVVTINKIPIKIIGVVEKKSVMDQRRQGQIYIPYTTASSRIVGSQEYSGFSMTVQKGFSINDAKQNIDNHFYEKHGQSRDFEIMTLDERLQDFYKGANGMKMFIMLIGAISLLVGGIGVMNIMLVSVTERTSEIGIRMAVGAQQNDIKSQFLIESIIVCLFGGLVGIVLAFSIGLILNPILAKNPDIMIHFSYSFASVLIAVFFSTLIGLVFGYFPAKNASKLDPVVALSQE